MAMWTILKEVHANGIATGEFSPFGDPYNDSQGLVEDKLQDLQTNDNQGFCYAAELIVEK